MRKLLKMLENQVSLFGQEKGVQPYKPEQDARNADSGNNAIQKHGAGSSSGAGYGGGNGGATGHHAAGSAGKTPSAPYKFKIPRFLGKRWFWGSLAVLFLNNVMQKADMKNYNTMVKFDRTELPPQQQGVDGPITAAVRIVNYNLVTQKQDTLYGLEVNQARMLAALVDKSKTHRSTAKFMKKANDLAHEVTGYSSEGLNKDMAPYLHENSRKVIPLSKPITDQVKLYQFHPLGVNINEFNATHNNEAGFKWKKRIPRANEGEETAFDKVKEHVTSWFFPTGSVIISSQALSPNSGITHNVDPDKENGGVERFEKGPDGTLHPVADVLAEYQENGMITGVIPVNKEEYKTVISGNKIHLNK